MSEKLKFIETLPARSVDLFGDDGLMISVHAKADPQKYLETSEQWEDFPGGVSSAADGIIDVVIDTELLNRKEIEDALGRVNNVLGTSFSIQERKEGVEDLKSAARKRYNRKGSLFSASVSGDIYYVGDTEYVVDTSGGNPVVYDCDTNEHVSDEEIIDSIKNQIEQDKEVIRARKKIAEILSNGDPILTQILEMHLEYNSGKNDFITNKDGIVFYSVGHNASHFFYAGTKNGKRYVYYYCPGECDFDENDELIEDEHGCVKRFGEEEGYYEITEDEYKKDGWGYIGHF